MNRTNHCPACQGGGLVPALGCTCDRNAHTCITHGQAYMYRDLGAGMSRPGTRRSPKQ